MTQLPVRLLIEEVALEDADDLRDPFITVAVYGEPSATVRFFIRSVPRPSGSPLKPSATVRMSIKGVRNRLPTPSALRASADFQRSFWVSASRV